MQLGKILYLLFCESTQNFHIHRNKKVKGLSKLVHVARFFSPSYFYSNFIYFMVYIVHCYSILCYDLRLQIDEITIHH
jgi:hypothetical protein